jgi:SAM-dependent methyltransferase
MFLRNLFISIGDAQYYHVLSNALANARSVLDVGCGKESPLRNVKKTFRSIGVDIYKQSIQKSKASHIHDAYIEGDVTKLKKYVKQKSFDVVIALDLIEHLTKKEGFQLMADMERTATKRVIIMTPNGFYHQDSFEGNSHQVHQSGWETSDFSKRGYTVYGLRGLRWIRGEYATIRFKPWFFWGIVSFLSQPFVYFLPKLAYQLFAVKEL